MKETKERNSLEPMIEYVNHYRNKRDRNLKYDFMPNLLEIIERPAHIGGAVIIWGICILLCAALVWSSLSELDVVVVSTGIVNPQGNVHHVQAVSSGTVSKIHVKSGEYVKEGMLLISLDIEELLKELSGIKDEIQLITIQNELYQHILDGKNIADIVIKDYEAFFQSYVSYIIEEEKYFLKSIAEYESDEHAERSRLQHKISLLSSVNSNKLRLKALQEQLVKTDYLIESKKLYAPVSGCISGLEEIEPGSVVVSGQQILSVVPEVSNMEIEYFIESRDIAQIAIGQEVEIKLDAYDYSEYGTVTGVITYISATTVSNKELGTVYAVKAGIEDATEDINMISGMKATVEVKIGKRTVLEYFLEPITGALGNAIKEK